MVEKKLFNARILAVLVSSFASGLPLLLTSQTLQAWYTESGVNLVLIGSLALVGLPYSLKFLWAPLLDRYRLFGRSRRRAWMLITQLGLMALLIIMAMFDPAQMPYKMASVALVIAFVAATQDIVIDAYRVDLLEPHERGIGSSMLQFGYRFGMLVASAAALIIAALFGWRITYLVMAVIMLIMAICTAYMPTPEDVAGIPTTMKEAVIMPVIQLMRKSNILLVVLFILLYKFSENMVFSMNMPFLLRHLGFSLVAVGVLNNTVSLVAVLLGSLLAGLLLPRLGMYRSLMLFGVLQLLSNLGYVFLALIGKNKLAMMATFFVEYFCNGLATVAFVSFMMGLCDKRYSATQYAYLSAVMALTRTVMGSVSGLLVNHVGWIQFYIDSVLIGLPALVVLWLINKRSSADQSGGVLVMAE